MDKFLDSMIEKLGKTMYLIIFAFVYSVLLTIVAFFMEKFAFNNEFMMNDAIRFALIFYVLGIMAARTSVKNRNRKCR